MKITYVNFSPIPSYQANSVNSVMTCQALAKAGHEVQLFVPGFSSAKSLLRQSGGDLGNFYSITPAFTYGYLPFAKLTDLGRWGRKMLSRVALSKAGAPDVIYTRRLEVALLAGLRGEYAIYEAHNFSKADPQLLDQWVRLLQGKESTVGMVSTTMASAHGFIESGVPKERIRVVANGVEFDKYQNIDSGNIRGRYGIPDGQLLVTYCGTMGESKGVNYVLECAKLLPDMAFLMVGGTPNELNQCKETVATLGITNVFFAGFIPHGEVPSHLCASDFLIFTLTRIPGYTHNYCSPMKMFEYMASGKPSVVTEFGSVHEILEDGKNAIIVEPDNAQSLATGLRRLGEDREFALAVGSLAHADARKYDWKERAKNIVDFVSETFPKLK